MKHEEYRRIDDNNRILISKTLRKALGVEPGDLLRISLLMRIPLPGNLRTEAEGEKYPVILMQKAEERESSLPEKACYCKKGD